jgi:hypothetical protein
VQQNIKVMLQLLLDTDKDVRQSTLQTMNLIIRFGLTNPLEVSLWPFSLSFSFALFYFLTPPFQPVPFLIALLGDHNSSIADSAYWLLSLIQEKHSSIIQSRFAEGLKSCFDFQMQVFGSCKGIPPQPSFLVLLPPPFSIPSTQMRLSSPVSSYLGDSTGLYSLIKKKEKLNTICSFVRAFENFEEQVRGGRSKEKKKKKRLQNSNCFLQEQFLSFLAQLLATFPYGTEDEPLYVIFNINRILSLHLTQLSADLKPVFGGKSSLQTLGLFALFFWYCCPLTPSLHLQINPFLPSVTRWPRSLFSSC